MYSLTTPARCGQSFSSICTILAHGTSINASLLGVKRRLNHRFRWRISLLNKQRRPRPKPVMTDHGTNHVSGCNSLLIANCLPPNTSPTIIEVKTVSDQKTLLFCEQIILRCNVVKTLLCNSGPWMFRGVYWAGYSSCIQGFWIIA